MRTLRVYKSKVDRAQYKRDIADLPNKQLDETIAEYSRQLNETTSRLAELWEERNYRVEYTGLPSSDKSPELLKGLNA